MGVYDFKLENQNSIKNICFKTRTRANVILY